MPQERKFVIAPCKWCGKPKANLGPWCDECRPSLAIFRSDRNRLIRKHGGGRKIKNRRRPQQ